MDISRVKINFACVRLILCLDMHNHVVNNGSEKYEKVYRNGNGKRSTENFVLSEKYCKLSTFKILLKSCQNLTKFQI